MLEHHCLLAATFGGSDAISHLATQNGVWLTIVGFIVLGLTKQYLGLTPDCAYSCQLCAQGSLLLDFGDHTGWQGSNLGQSCAAR